MAFEIRTLCFQIDEKFKKNKSRTPKSESQNISSNSNLKQTKHFQNSKLPLISKLYLFCPYKKIETAMCGFLYHIFEMLTMHPTLRGKNISALITHYILQQVSSKLQQNNYFQLN